MKKNMTVGELIEELKQYDENSEVRFAYNFGDHCHTQVAETIGSVDSGLVQHSDYHRMDKVVELDDDGEMPDEAKEVVILSGR